MSAFDHANEFSTAINAEMLAQDLIEHGEFDQAIAIYQQIQPPSVQILHAMGMLYTNKIGNYELAISCFEEALNIQEKNGEDISDSLTKLGFAYQNLFRFELALIYHHRALNLRRLQPNIDQRLIASNLFGMANAYWGQENLSDALIYAQQALQVNRSIKSGNETNIASNLAILANIYHHCGNDNQALDLAKESIGIFESLSSSNLVGLASVLNNLGAIQLSAGLVDEALVTFIRVLHTCENTVPEGHPKRIAITQNIERVIALQRQQQQVANSFSDWCELSSKFLLF